MKSGLWVNPGRKPTRIGGDGILPYMIVPHWAASHVAAFLREHSVEFTIDEGFMRSHRDRLGPEDCDKLTFPRAAADVLQRLVDRIDPPLRPPWESK